MENILLFPFSTLGLSKPLAVTFRIRIFVVFVSWQSEGIFTKLFCQIRLGPAKLENGNILMSQIKNLRCHGRFWEGVMMCAICFVLSDCAVSVRAIVLSVQLAYISPAFWDPNADSSDTGHLHNLFRVLQHAEATVLALQHHLLENIGQLKQPKTTKVTKNSTMRPTTRTAATTTKSQNDSHIFNTHTHELAAKRPIRAACCNFVYAMKRKNAYWPYWEILLPRVRALCASLLSRLQFKKILNYALPSESAQGVYCVHLASFAPLKHGTNVFSCFTHKTNTANVLQKRRVPV